MDLDYNVTPIFPTCIHTLRIKNFDEYKDKLIEETYQEREENSIGRQVSNCGGWQSKMIFITECKSETLKKIIIDSLSTFKPIKPNVHMVVEGWKNINEPGNFNTKHYHPRSTLSGVLWIKTPDNSGDILFESPHEFNRFNELDCYTDEFKNETNFYNTYRFSPKEGKMLIFPSDLQHQVNPNKSKEDRISYSFNIKLN
jgi:uncharacterized protein (TIGR02466 family)|tara:strand:+ start:189 stop:785 length:597 start_codon:yes stop_codon:yes gene_type:complete